MYHISLRVTEQHCSRSDMPVSQCTAVSYRFLAGEEGNIIPTKTLLYIHIMLYYTPMFPYSLLSEPVRFPVAQKLTTSGTINSIRISTKGATTKSPPSHA